MEKYSVGLFVFRRDLRIEDNTGLFAALACCQRVYTCFVFDQRQIAEHPYRSINGLQFLLESLRGLEDTLRQRGAALIWRSGTAEDQIPRLMQELNAEALFLNKDYTPFSRQRDKRLSEAVAALGRKFHSYSDLLLQEPSSFAKPDGNPYTVFTPFYKRAQQFAVRPVAEMPSYGSLVGGESNCSLEVLMEALPANRASSPRRNGGRKEALRLIEQLPKKVHYKEERDIPAIEGTTTLSAHHKYGTCSIREVYWAVQRLFGVDCTLIRELYWRDFFTHIAWHFPRVFEGAFKIEYNALKWSEDASAFKRWCEGNTGFPIVDAGMRELVQTGYMHNRVRMIVASFLTKDLHISWRWGEQYFAKHLIDYDPAVNNGSWQWAASTGCDAQPYFRIFNPWLQQARFDPDCIYIKRWVPELAALPAKTIHGFSDVHDSRPASYPAPMVEHAFEKDRALEMFEVIKNG